jgi:hypothetical protein
MDGGEAPNDGRNGGRLRTTAAGRLQLPKLSSEIHKQAQHHICLENPLL